MRIHPIRPRSSAVTPPCLIRGLAANMVQARHFAALGRLRRALGTSHSLLVLRIRYRNRHLGIMPFAAARALGEARPALRADDAGATVLESLPREVAPSLGSLDPLPALPALDVMA